MLYTSAGNTPQRNFWPISFTISIPLCSIISPHRYISSYLFSSLLILTVQFSFSAIPAIPSKIRTTSNKQQQQHLLYSFEFVLPHYHSSFLTPEKRQFAELSQLHQFSDLQLSNCFCVISIISTQLHSEADSWYHSFWDFFSLLFYYYISYITSLVLFFPSFLPSFWKKARLVRVLARQAPA